MSSAALESPAGRHPAQPAVPRLPALLGALGALPFLALAGAVIAGLRPDWAMPALLLYGAAILSFMGGIHWGLAMTSRPGSAQLGLSVVPALVAWPEAFLGGPAGLALLAFAFALLLPADLAAVRAGNAPAWYPALRVPLTLVVCGALFAASLAR